MTELVGRVREVVAEVLGADVQEVNADSGMNEVEGWDSFSHLQIIGILEEELGVSIPPRMIPNATTVAKLADAFSMALTKT